MIFKFAEAIPFFTGHSRPFFGWLSHVQNALKANPREHDQQRTTMGTSIFGLLISNDAARGRLI